MQEQPFSFESDPSTKLSGTLCLPDDASAKRPVPAMVLLGGTFGDTRDGDMDPARNPYAGSVPSNGLLRRIAHSMAAVGVASLRFDKRGCGESQGSAEDAGADQRDAIEAVRSLRLRPAIDPARVGASGHSAGASLVVGIARLDPDLACAGLLGMLFSSLEDLVRWNWGRVAALWPQLTEEQRDWMRANRKREVVGAFRCEEFIEAARSGQPRIRLEAEGASIELDLVRFREGMERYRATPRLEQYRHVRCPALLLHGGEDMNVNVEDALASYKALREVGNERVDLVIVPRVDHNYQVVATEPVKRLWERVSFLSQGNVVSPTALRALSGWAARVMSAQTPPSARDISTTAATAALR
jgi:pimeloyl-ACP methyl ester carboxylesterase